MDFFPYCNSVLLIKSCPRHFNEGPALSILDSVGIENQTIHEPLASIPPGRLRTLTRYENKPGIGHPHLRTLGSVLPRQLFKQHEQPSCTPTLPVQSSSSPIFEGFHCKIWLPFDLPS